MMLAIEDVFYQIQEEEIRIENIFCDQFCLLYNNIRALSTHCKAFFDKKAHYIDTTINIVNLLLCLN